MLKSKVKEILSSPYFFYFLLFIIVFLFHQLMFFSNDDVNFFSHQLDMMSWFDFLKWRYSTWTSRILIEGFLVIISRNIYVWRILDSLVICLLIYSINRICFQKFRLRNLGLILLIFCFYPFSDMKEAGFCATTLNYLWPLTFLLFSILPFKDLINGEKTKKWCYPFYILAFLYACNQEQAVCIGLVLSILMIIYCIRNKKNITYPFLLGGIAVISLLFILNCPGNHIRAISEANTWYDLYQNANIIDKVYLGISSSISILMSDVFLLWLLSGILVLSILRSDQNKINKLIAGSQFFIITSLSIVRLLSFIFHKRYLLFSYYTESAHPFQGTFLNIIFLLLGIGVIFIFCYLLFQLLHKKSFLPILLIMLGCGTRVMMGFSPTVFASGSRTMIFLDFSFILVILLLWEQFREFYKTKDKVLLLCVCSLISIGNIILFIGRVL